MKEENNYLSRPEFHRTGLGPLMHIIGHDIFDRIDERVFVGDILDSTVNVPNDIPTTLGELTKFVMHFAMYGSEVAGEVAREKEYSPIAFYLTMNKGNTDLQGVGALAVESTAMGILMPMHLMKAIIHKEESLNLRYKNSIIQEDIDIWPEDIADRFTDETFRQMIDIMANRQKGVYGFDNLNSKSLDKELISDLDFKNRKDPFLTDNNGMVIGFKDEVIDSFADEIRSNNIFSYVEDFEGFKESIGCPARNAEFNEIDDIAQHVINMMSEEKRSYLDKKESLINRATRSIRLAIRVLVDNI